MIPFCCFAEEEQVNKLHHNFDCMQYLLLIITTLSLYSSAIRPSQEEEIRWSQKSVLSFSDFKGKVPENTPWAALTASYIYFTYSTSNGSISNIHVYASFKKHESWMKTAREDVLAHEQLHFAITEYFARKLYHDSQQLRTERGNVAAAASSLFKAINQECDDMQETYDEETDHGIKPESQEKWKKRIEGLMKAYPPYPETSE